jgi:hypothetical protein
MLELTIDILGKQTLILKGNAKEMAEFVHYYGLTGQDDVALHDTLTNCDDAGYIANGVKDHTRKKQSRRAVSDERPSKRTRILEVLASLRDEGELAPGTPIIISRFKRMFPEENASNLDQVLRDLVNKTDRVRRAKWGCFSLVSQTP